MDRKADLHLHTSASDGTIPPEQVVAAAVKAGLAAVAITDHDTVGGIDEALDAGERLGVEVIPGIELSALYQDRTEVHVLGYFLDHHNESLCVALRTLENARHERGRLMVERLNEAGVPITFERVLEIAQGGAIGRPHVAKAICEVNAASSIDAAFGKFLLEGGPGYVERYKITPQEAVRMILDAGGVPGVAHVAKLNRDELLVDLMKHGLRAIEVSHPDHTSAGSRFYKKFAARHDLIATGGSDAHFHENGRYAWVGDVSVDYEIVERLQQARDEIRGTKHGG